MKFSMGAGARAARCAVTVITALSLITPALAQETVSYTYDSLGRLAKVARSGTVNNGATECYSYDNAQNRTNVTVQTSTACTPAAGAVTFTVNNPSVTEGGNLVFTITKAGTASGTTTIDYVTANGTATAGSDYTAKALTTLTFLATDTTKTVSVATIDDTAVESAETVLLNLSNATGGASISDSQGVGTINDNDIAGPCNGVTFTIKTNGAVTEGTSAVFTVTKAGTTSSSCSVSYASADGTAKAGADYTATSGTLTFTSAQVAQSIVVPTTDDTTKESAETLKMSLSSPSLGGALGTPSSATGTINDNDTAPTFSINDVSATEGQDLLFSVTKTGTVTSSFSVSFATANGSALSPGKYTATSGTLTFAPADTVKVITVHTVLTSAVEPEKDMYVNLSSPTGGATITRPQGMGAIFDSCGGAAAATTSSSTTQSTDQSSGATSPQLTPVC